MGAWGDGPFECDSGLDAAFALLDHLARQVEQTARGTGGDRSSVVYDTQALAAHVALLCLVAEAVYRPAMFVPIRGMPLPDADVVSAWRDKFLARYARLAGEELEATPAELERLAQEAAGPLARLAEVSRRHVADSEATHQAVETEVVAARQQEARQRG
jgi:hypothetical protein